MRKQLTGAETVPGTSHWLNKVRGCALACECDADGRLKGPGKVVASHASYVVRYLLSIMVGLDCQSAFLCHQA